MELILALSGQGFHTGAIYGTRYCPLSLYRTLYPSPLSISERSPRLLRQWLGDFSLMALSVMTMRGAMHPVVIVGLSGLT